MKRTNGFVAVTAALLVGTLAACGSSGEAPQPQVSGSGNATEKKVESIASLLPKDVAKSGTIKAGTAASSAPEGFKTETGGLDGYEIEIVEGIADVLGLKVDWQVTDFASLIPSLKSDRFSLGTGLIGITAERAKIADFVTLIISNQAFAALKTAGLHDVTINDLCGKAVAVIQGSRQQGFGEDQSKTCLSKGQSAINLQVFQNNNDAWLAMKSKRTDIYWSGATNVGYLVAQTSDAEIVGHHLQSYPSGIALNKDSPIGPAVEAALQHLIEDGTYQKILDKWGLKDNAISKAKLNPDITW